MLNNWRLDKRSKDDWIASLKSIRSRLAATLVGPVELLKYLPYRRHATAYMLTKVPALRSAEPEALQIPPSHLWVGYGETVEEYLASGREDFDALQAILAGAGCSIGAGERVLDFGCAAGRMTRWLINHTDTGEVWGADISAEHVVWCKQHLSPPFHFLTSTTVPHLPFEDRYFDLVFAGSVFTHIDDLVDAWILELRRILKVGGRLFLTIHDNELFSKVVDGELRG
jgi:SAM-dependent methyltransferase